eukprot:15441553-Alexandrium_andersonii.AAC.1
MIWRNPVEPGVWELTPSNESQRFARPKSIVVIVIARGSWVVCRRSSLPSSSAPLPSLLVL